MHVAQLLSYVYGIMENYIEIKTIKTLITEDFFVFFPRICFSRNLFCAEI